MKTKRVAHYRERYLQEVFATPWLALRRNGCYRDLRIKILRLALPQYFEWEADEWRKEGVERWRQRPCSFPYLNCTVDLCQELPFGETEGKELRLLPLRIRLHKFQPVELVWNWVHPYATDI